MSVVLIAALVFGVLLVATLMVLSLRLERGAEGEQAEIECRHRILLEDLGAKEPSDAARVTLGGRAFEISLARGRTGKPVLAIATYVGPEGASRASAKENARENGKESASVVVRRETKVDRLGKALRINREVQTGDDAFDAAAYVESDASDEDVARVLGDASVRRHAYALLGQGYSSVTIPVGSGRVEASRDAFGIGLEPLAVRAACDDLAALASAIPMPKDGARAPSPWLIGPLTAGLCAVFLFVGFYLFTSARATHFPLARGATLFGVGLGLFTWVLVLPLIGALVRGRSGSFRVFGACFALLLVGLPLTSAGLAVDLNARLDAGEPALYQAHVQAKWSRSIKGSTSYYVRIEGLSEGGSSLELPVEQEIFSAVREGETVVVEVGRGRFGWSWLRRIRRGS